MSKTVTLESPPVGKPQEAYRSQRNLSKHSRAGSIPVHAGGRGNPCPGTSHWATPKKGPGTSTGIPPQKGPGTSHWDTPPPKGPGTILCVPPRRDMGPAVGSIIRMEMGYLRPTPRTDRHL